MVSMKDISAACGVSVATVSKALNNHSDIGEATKEKIRKMAKEMGYFPNSMARALKTNRTYNIGVLFEDAEGSGLTYDYFSYMLDYFKKTVEQKGYDITFLNSRCNTRMSFLEHCMYRNFDGVFIACTDFYDPQVIELVQSDIPVVTIDHIFDNCICIISDNVDGMRQLVEYAYACGHRKIAYIHGPACSVTKARLSSFYNTCERLNIEVPDEYVCEASYRGDVEAKIQTERLLDLPDPPTCILYPDDLTSYRGISAIRERNLSVPEDISIIGYDGAKSCQMGTPLLTTFQQNTKSLGEQAGKMLLSLIEKPKTTIIRNVEVQGTILKGGTVKNLNENVCTNKR